MGVSCKHDDMIHPIHQIISQREFKEYFPSVWMRGLIFEIETPFCYNDLKIGEKSST